MKNKVVLFTKRCGNYNEGETAGFPADQADLIVEKKCGRFLSEAEVKALDAPAKVESKKD